MSGHSKWATTHRQKAIVDAKRGAAFTKLGNMIALAARGGADPTLNTTLAMAIEKARAANMPKENIQRAIDRVADKNAAALEEATYEAYGPGGIGIVVEIATDNKNRTYPEVRTALTKHGATMADGGSVLFQFTRKGVIIVKETGEDALLTILDAGAEDALEEEGETIVYTDQKDLAKVRTAIMAAGLTVLDAELRYVPNNMVEVTDTEVARKIENILDAVESIDEVVGVHINGDFQVTEQE
jgi:YebC/PmpR family DNA-binding regulatory protein